MKELLTIIIGLGFGLSLMSCSGESGNLVQSDEQVIALEAISSSMLLSYDQSSVQEMKNTINDNNISDNEINDLDYYVEMVEALLGNDNLEVETQVSDNENYEMMISYKTYSLNQGEMIYTLYYNLYDFDQETITDSETLAFDNQKKSDKSFIFNDEDDQYASQAIKGILIYGNMTYDVEGKVLNVEGREIIRVRSFINEDNFVLVNYQKDDIDIEREKFFFQVVDNGQVIKKSRVMVFNNNKMQHVQLEFIDDNNYEKYQFHIREKDKVTYIHISYSIDNEEETIQGVIRLNKTLDPQTNEFIYTYNVDSSQGNENHYMRRHHYNQGMFNNNKQDKHDNCHG